MKAPLQLVLAAGATLLSSQVDGQTIVQTCNGHGGTTQSFHSARFDQPFTYSLFDPSLGTLTAVGLNVTVNSARGTVREVNILSSPVAWHPTLAFDLVVLSPGPQQQLWSAGNFSGAVQPLTPSGTPGDHGEYVVDLAAPFAQSCQLDLAPYCGVGTGSLLFGMMLQGGDQYGTTLLDADLTATLTYTYTPAQAAPDIASTAGLVLAGVLLLGVGKLAQLGGTAVV